MKWFQFTSMSITIQLRTTFSISNDVLNFKRRSKKIPWNDFNSLQCRTKIKMWFSLKVPLLSHRSLKRRRSNRWLIPLLLTINFNVIFLKYVNGTRTWSISNHKKFQRSLLNPNLLKTVSWIVFVYSLPLEPIRC